MRKGMQKTSHLGETIVNVWVTLETHALKLTYDLMKTQTPLSAEFLAD